MFYQGKARHEVREVILHCAAIKTGQFAGMGAFQIFSIINRWHKEKGWKNGFGYHGLITPEGVFYKGRPFDMIGAHTIGHNAGTLGFLLIESQEIERMGLFSEYFTEAQAQTLLLLLDGLRERGITKVSGHNDYAPKLCPGFKVETSDWLP
ncbi:N-acetylmuramoyl-L-alanine amidase [Rhodobacter ferrooxidans]|uniref:N-acetylmuramoyl-L-alanine amidase family 2 n=1 Tax=Rhodobacter ferrooxidans TaxID=371731 RepID=C8RZ59_9RHOB|nr:N-acetylmuramoyl-L-alanine amidase [Rhodobacter sp. SW2]EEW26016.1 N-acetylmuramoyl-L-alanine amidase family 2 [Rhodobacter sp. SW2]